MSRDEIIRILLQTGGIGEARKLRDELDGIVGASDRAAKSQVTFGQAINQSKLALAGAGLALAGVARSFSLAAQEASQFESSIAALSTIAGDANMDALAASVRQLGAEYGNVQGQAKGLYEIIAAGIEDPVRALGILGTANRLAIGGVADLQIASSGLVATLNAYGLAAEDARRVSDAFFVSAAAGNTTIEQLGQNIGSVAPLAASTGVELEQLLAAIGTLTAGGVSTSQAMTQVQSALTAVVKPSAEATAAALDLGIQFDTAALKSKGFATFLSEIATAAGGNETVLAQLFGRVEGLQGVLALTGNQAETFARTLEDMGNSAGRTDAAYAKIAETSAQSTARFRAAVDLLQIAFGNILTAFVPVVNGLTSVANSFLALPQPVQTVAAALAGLALVMTPLAVAFRALAPAIAALVRTLPAMAGAAVAAATNVGLLAAAATRLAAALAAGFAVDRVVAAYNAVRDLNDITAQVVRNEQELARVRGQQVSQIDQIKRAYGDFANLQLRSSAEINSLNAEGLELYGRQLAAAAQFWRAVEVEARRAGEAAQQAFAREQADRYSQAVAGVEASLTKLAEAATRAGQQIGVIKDVLVPTTGAVLDFQRGLNDAGTQGADALGKPKEQLESTGRALSNASRETRRLKEEQQQAGEQVDITAKKQEGAANALSGVLNGMREGLRQFGDEAVSAFDKAFAALAGPNNVLETSGRTYAQVLQLMANTANAVATEFKLSQEATERQAIALDRLSNNTAVAAQALSDLGYTAEDVRNGTVTTSVALRALNNVRMDRLQGELQGVLGGLEGIDAAAAAAGERLRQLTEDAEREALRRAGDERALAEREYQDRLREISELEASASAADRDRAARLRQLEEANHQARLREIREEAREREAAQRPASSSGSGGGSGGSSAGQGGGGGSGRGPGQPGVPPGGSGTPVVINLGGQSFSLRLAGANDVATLQRLLALLRNDAMASGYGGSALR